MQTPWDVVGKLILTRLFQEQGIAVKTEWEVGVSPFTIDAVAACTVEQRERLAQTTP